MSSALLVRTVYEPGERHERHAHAYTSVSVVLAGSLVECVGRTVEHAGPLSVVVKPAGTEHADTFGPAGALLLRFQIAPHWVTTLDDGSDAIGRWRWCSAPATSRWLLRLATGHTEDICSADDGIAECLGALGDDVTATAAAGVSSNVGIPSWLFQTRDRIRDERGRGAGVETLARAAGVHPVYLTRRFRQAFGCSIVGFSQSERVRAAAGAIASSDESLSAIADRAGFADQPHLTRSFRRFAGVTPATYRRIAYAGRVRNVQDSSRGER